MPSPYSIPLWKSSPFVRLLLPLAAGMLSQWYLPLSILMLIGLLSFFMISFFLFYLFPVDKRFRIQYVHGALINLIIFCSASLLIWKADIRHDKNWFGNFYSDSIMLIGKINEPPIEKDNSFKAEATVETVLENNNYNTVTGKIIVYFAKEDSMHVPRYGDRICIRGGLQLIKNSGNPGSFDYERFLSFQQIFHQRFLKKDDYVLLNSCNKNFLYNFIFFSREKLLNILQHYIKGNKKVTGVAEALLIGYKQDLDRDMVQAYRNTGVVHIIIIAGMHLGLISLALVWLFSRLPVLKKMLVFRTLLIICCVWLFALITGASVPVMRSAVMFTCIMIGRQFFRRTSVYNSLAASAFILLCYDPYLLWDVGFRLSYAAVTGIVWLQKPIASIFFTENKLLRKVWEMCALSLAAQIFTAPLCIYYFHQLPVTFLITNILCVPIFTIILFGEIALIPLSLIAPLAVYAGNCVYVLTALMNFIITACNRFPFALIDHIYATPLTTALLYFFIIFLCSGLLKRNKKLLKTAAGFLLIFSGLWSYGRISLLQQKKIIIYNVSRHTAIDFIAGNRYSFYSDSTASSDAHLSEFVLDPARQTMQAEKQEDSLPDLFHRGMMRQFYNKQIMIIDSDMVLEMLPVKLKPDILLVCGNPKLSIKNITSAVMPAVIVFDGSNNLWKIGQWKKECEELHLPFYITPGQGAFILNAD